VCWVPTCNMHVHRARHLCGHQLQAAAAAAVAVVAAAPAAGTPGGTHCLPLLLFQQLLAVLLRPTALPAVLLTLSVKASITNPVPPGPYAS
jgi:hypothetical protein